MSSTTVEPVTPGVLVAVDLRPGGDARSRDGMRELSDADCLHDGEECHAEQVEGCLEVRHVMPLGGGDDDDGGGQGDESNTCHLCHGGRGRRDEREHSREDGDNDECQQRERHPHSMYGL